jgi:hypothetical protein
MKLKLIDTKIANDLVLIRYADDADNAKAKHWIDLCLPLAKLGLNDLAARNRPKLLAAARDYLLTVVREDPPKDSSKLPENRYGEEEPDELPYHKM